MKTRPHRRIETAGRPDGYPHLSRDRVHTYTGGRCLETGSVPVRDGERAPPPHRARVGSSTADILKFGTGRGTLRGTVVAGTGAR